MIAFASSLDQAGVLTRSARTRRCCFGAMAGFDPRDSTSVNVPVPDYVAELSRPLAGLRVGVIREFFDKGLRALRRKLVQDAIEALSAAGRRHPRREPARAPLSVPTYYVGLRQSARRTFRGSMEFGSAPLRGAARPAGPVQALEGEGFGPRSSAAS